MNTELLRLKKIELQNRLSKGESVIGEMQLAGKTEQADQQTDFWIKLLREYEVVCKQLNEYNIQELRERLTAQTGV